MISWRRIAEPWTKPNTVAGKIPLSFNIVSGQFRIMRISDIYLIRAEAKLRSGDADGALADVNYIRERRSAAGKTLPLLSSVTWDDVLKERGFELYWEGLRRQDLVRFGKFGDAWWDKQASAEAQEIFPYPDRATGNNPNLSN